MKQRILHFSVAIALSGFTVAAAQNRGLPAQNPQQTPAAARATIEGTVTRAGAGQPLKGARVTLSRGNAGQNALAGLAQAGADIQNRLGGLIANIAGGATTVTTDGNGRFTFTGVDPGQYRIAAEREGYIRSEYGQRTPTGNGIAFSVAASARMMVDLQMTQASVISGRVVTPDGEAGSQHTVQAYAYRYANGERTLAQVSNTRTNDLGEYRLFWFEPGEYFVSVVSPEATNDAPPSTIDVSQARGGRGGAQQNIQLLTSALGGTLGGRGEFVQVLGGGGTPAVYYPGTIDPDGAVPVTVAASVEVRGIDFQLRPVRTATVSGRVVAPFSLAQNQANEGFRGARGARGAQANGATPQIQLLGPPVQLSLTRLGSARAGLAGLIGLGIGATPVSADGSFEIKGVAPGQYNLTATARDPNGQEYTARTRVDVGTADVANLVVAVRPGAEVRGRIVLETTPPQQFKMTNLRVALVADGGAAGGIAALAGLAGGGGRGGGRGAEVLAQLGGQGGAGAVAEDGIFSIQNVGALEYRVRVIGLPQGAYTQSGRIGSDDALNAPFSVDNQQAVLQLQIGFTPARVTGIVTDTKGAPAPGTQAVLVPDVARRGRTDAYFTATSNETGQFTLNNVPPGAYKLFAWEDIPAGAYQYPDFIRRYEDRGQQLTVNANGTLNADVRLIPAN